MPDGRSCAIFKSTNVTYIVIYGCKERNILLFIDWNLVFTISMHEEDSNSMFGMEKWKPNCKKIEEAHMIEHI